MKKSLLLSLLTFPAAICFAQVDVAATSGTATATYTTLKGAFDAINAGTHQGAITLSITANTTETAQAVLNASGGTVNYTSVMIKPATGVVATVSGSLASDALVKILGSNVTIDGSNSGGTTRDLTITNTSATSPVVLTVHSPSSTAPVHHITLKNTIFVNGVNTSSAVVFHDGAATPVGGYFNNITITNNVVNKAYIAFYLMSAIESGSGANTVISNNDLSTTGANAIRMVGVYLQGWDGATVENNTIGNFDTTNAEIRRGVWLATGTVNTLVSNNTISNLNYTGTSGGGAAGISVTPGNTGASSAANVTVSGNTISNFTSSGSGSIFSGIYVAGTLTNGVKIEKNKISTIKNTNTGGYGSQGIYLASTSTASNMLVANNLISGVSAYGYSSLGGVNDNANGIIITAGGGYKVYHNTVAMNVSGTSSSRSSAFNVTSGVTAAGAIDVRNNLFSNTQTQTGEKYAVYCGASNSVFSNMNYNNYYSSGTNLGYIGSTRATLADVQAGFSGNVNSLNVEPIYTSATDFHPTVANTALDNKGTPLADVLMDLDGVVRSTTTPDLGVYEFATTTMAVNETSKATLSYYPNPVVDVLTINNPSSINAVEIFNTVGQKVQSHKSDNKKKVEIDMSNLKSGMYLVKVYSGDKEEVIKVMKR